MLFLVGIGLQAQHVTSEAVETVSGCSCVYADAYTSKAAGQQGLPDFERVFQKKIIPVSRFGVEEDFRGILLQAQKENVALLVFGNALTATTHVQVLLDARQAGVPAKVVPGISITNFLGETGLDAYNFGRITSIVAPKNGYAPQSFFSVIEKNKKAGYHTLCLLDLDVEKNYFMPVAEALAVLEKIAAKKKSSLLKKSLFVGLYGLGSKQQAIRVGSANELKSFSSSVFPQSVVVCAQLNEKEKECVGFLHGHR